MKTIRAMVNQLSAKHPHKYVAVEKTCRRCRHSAPYQTAYRLYIGDELGSDVHHLDLTYNDVERLAATYSKMIKLREIKNI